MVVGAGIYRRECCGAEGARPVNKRPVHQTPDVYLGLFDDDNCTYVTDRKGDYALRKLQRGLSVIETWCERWNIKIIEDTTRAIYFSHRLSPLEAHLTLN
jgi:hypothetical protein